MKAVLMVLVGVLSPILAGSANAQIVLGPGQSQTISCSSNGGGGGNNSSCVQDLSPWCYSNTTRSRDVCFEQTSRYCPSVSFSTCVKETAAYCYSNTSMGRDQCFDSALGTCRGNPLDVRNLLRKVMESGRLIEKGVNPASLKSQEAVKSDI
jgi:hypothetical protein